MSSGLRFHPLTFLDDGDDVVVGRRDVDSYVALPPEGAQLLRRLTDGASPAEAATWFLVTYGEPVDIDDFVATLAEAGFLSDSTEDGVPSPDLAPTAPLRWQRLAGAMFSWPAWLVYGGIVLAAVAACLDSPSLIPRHTDVFFTSSLVVIEVVLMLASLPLTLLHELFHVLAGRRLGLRSRVGLGNRFYFLVFETVMDGLVSVPRRQRYLPMLAGLLADTVVLAGLICLAWLLRGPAAGLPAAQVSANLAMALAFTTLPRMAWQGYFFLRTDGYYLVATVTGCQNLQEAGWWRLRSWLARLSGGRFATPEVGEERFGAADLRVSRWYAPLLLLGYALALLTLVLIVVPLAWTFLSLAGGRAFGGAAASTAQFVDAAVILAVTAGQLLLAGWLALRGRRSRRSGATPTD